MEIKVDEIRTNYLVLGQGNPFLILHGWGSNSLKWQETGKILKEKGFKVIVPDLPGFGKSEEPKKPWSIKDYSQWLLHFIEKCPEIDEEKFYLLGHSFGGALAVFFALNNSEKIKKIFLVAAACIRRKTIKKKIFKTGAKFFKVFNFLPFYNLFRRAFYKFIIRKSDYPRLKGIMKQSYLQVIGKDLSSELESLDLPCVVIWGDKDDVLPLKDAYLIHKKIKNSKLVIIPGEDHDLEQRNPEILVQKILENI